MASKMSSSVLKHVIPADEATASDSITSSLPNGANLHREIPLRRALQDKVALVTGSSSGIGQAIAHALAEAGANLALVSRRSQTRFDGQLDGSSKVKWYSCDLANEVEVQSLSPKIESDFGGIDILVHAAGIFAHDDAQNTPAFEQQYRVNLVAPHSLTRQMSASLRARHGQVVFINSSVARTARAGVSQYAATKSGLKAVADAFREELNPHGVRVLSVFVGRTATPMQEAIFKQEGRQYVPERLLQPADVASVVLNCLTLPRTAEVTEIDIRPMLKT